MTVDWAKVAQHAEASLARGERLDEGQRDSLAWIIRQMQECAGVVLADEVGTGKTRIACAVIHAVLAAGGRVATVVPKGLMHQWVAESHALDLNIAPKLLTTIPELFRSVTSPDHWKTLAPNPEASEWWLISHNFRAPQVRSNSNLWRAALPSLVELKLASKTTREDKRTREGRFAEWLGLSEKLATKRWAHWDGMELIAEDLKSRVRGNSPLRRKLARLPEIRITKRNGQLFTDLDLVAYQEANGEQIAEELLGIWLGAFDLISVDEAHKSRGSVEADDDSTRARTGKVLTRLLGRILQPSTTARRLCLTATPMELSLDQWLDLLGRAGTQLTDGRQIIDRLNEATRNAAVAPDEVARLDELCVAARAFTRALSPYVTRRRRTEDPLMKECQLRAGSSNGPHPHRRVEAVRIGWAEVAARSMAWLDVLFAAECMSHAARGLPLSHTASWPAAIRDAYTKLCKGHVSADFEDADESIRVPPPEEADEHTRGKIIRVNYWYRQLRGARARVSDAAASDALIESEHPRITAAVREIEAWTNPKEGHAEKVLLFGVFLRPLKVLRDVLNVRSTLRAVDAGQPIAHSIERNDELMPIAARQLARLRDEGGVRDRLLTATATELRRALTNAHGEYESLQRRVRRLITAHTDRWFIDPQMLGGVDDQALKTSVRAHAMAFVLDEFLSGSTSITESIEDRVATLANDYFVEHLREELTDLDADEDDARSDALRAVFVDDPDARQRRFAVLLAGDTQPTTRRYMQAAFNRAASSPRVLLAQSQVGREGLNLHKACRVVMQFHAEWNPAILEQQIGRVDRKGSLWEKLARQWLDHGDAAAPMPRIEVRQLVFEGTYDAYQWERVGRRQRMFDASLFGTLLSAEAWQRVPANRVTDLEDAAPSFRPPPR
jgi:hypothetical protein